MKTSCRLSLYRLGSREDHGQAFGVKIVMQTWSGVDRGAAVTVNLRCFTSVI